MSQLGRWLLDGVRDLLSEFLGVTVGLLALVAGGYVWVTWSSGYLALAAVVGVIVVVWGAAAVIGRHLETPKDKGEKGV